MRLRKWLMWCLCALSLAIVGCNGDGEVVTTPPSVIVDPPPEPPELEPPAPEPPPTLEPSTLQVVQDRGVLKCGVNEGLTGFTNVDEDGLVDGGFDADFCRAIAAAVLGEADAVDFVPLTTADRWDHLRDGKVDVLIRNTTWTSARDARFDFGPTTFHDGQQLMGPADSFRRDSTAAELEGSTVCVTGASTTKTNLEEEARSVGVEIEIVVVEDSKELAQRLKDGECDAITADGSALVSLKEEHRRDDEWVVFPTIPISREPLGPVYRSDDSDWADVVNWTIFATIIADEKGISSRNVEESVDDPPDFEASLLLGGSNGLGIQLGLESDAFYNVISQVGNYQEIFEQNLGPVGITRDGSLNASVLETGLMLAPPVRAP